MGKAIVKDEIITLIRNGIKPCRFETAFFLNGELYGLDRKSRDLEELQADEVSQWERLKIIAFAFGCTWDRSKREFDNAGFVSGLPEAVRSARNLVILNCEGTDRANEFIGLIRKNEYTGFYSLLDPQNINGVASPGTGYIYLK